MSSPRIPPFHPDGSLNLAVVEKQAAHYLKHNLPTVFVAGAIGECHSLTLDERRTLAQRWSDVIRGAAWKQWDFSSGSSNTSKDQIPSSSGLG
ncbi:MAG: hypothetical protein DME26_21280, partial [Verrucomicrobia bacterium]